MSISGDGATVVVGAYGLTVGPNGGAGGVFVFIMVGASWSGTVTGTSLIPNPASYLAGANSLGTSVSISTDGLTIAG